MQKFYLTVGLQIKDRKLGRNVQPAPICLHRNRRVLLCSPLKGNTLCLAWCVGRVVIRGCVCVCGFWFEVMLQLDRHGQAMKT